MDKLSDQIGFDTLDSISQAGRFNEWMYKTVSKHTFGEILEIGSGIGNITRFYVADNLHISASDMRKEYCETLEERFLGENNFRKVYQLDIVDTQFDLKHSSLFGKFNSVFALNIIEHIENDDTAIKNCLKLLKPEGKLVILVPAFMFLFNTFDQNLGHYRRYTRHQLKNLFVHNNIRIQYSRYFNFAGMTGWWFSGTVLKEKTIPSGQMKLFNFLVPVFKGIDFLINRFAGLSVIVAGEKSGK